VAAAAADGVAAAADGVAAAADGVAAAAAGEGEAGAEAAGGWAWRVGGALVASAGGAWTRPLPVSHRLRQTREPGPTRPQRLPARSPL